MKSGYHPKANDPKIISHINPVPLSIVYFQLILNCRPRLHIKNTLFYSYIYPTADLVNIQILVYRITWFLKHFNNR